MEDPMKKTLKPIGLLAAGGALGFIMLAAAALVTGARPWQSRPYPDVVSAAGPAQTVPMTSGMHAEKMPEGMMEGGMATGQGMMSGGMAMMAQHQETAKLIDQLVASFAAIDAEKDPAVLKGKLAEHGTLLKQLQAKSQESMRMMGKIQEHMKTCPMMTGAMMSGETSK
jgi:hypothetical protein